MRAYGLFGQCKAKSSRAQRQCRQPCVPGLLVCWYHGGATKRSQRAAALRLVVAAQPALGTLQEAVAQGLKPSSSLGSIARAERALKLIVRATEKVSRKQG